jgi:hypothetical protein
MVDRSPEATRQLASRARRRVREAASTTARWRVSVAGEAAESVFAAVRELG